MKIGSLGEIIYTKLKSDSIFDSRCYTNIKRYLLRWIVSMYGAKYNFF